MVKQASIELAKEQGLRAEPLLDEMASEHGILLRAISQSRESYVAFKIEGKPHLWVKRPDRDVENLPLNIAIEVKCYSKGRRKGVGACFKLSVSEMYALRNYQEALKRPVMVHIYQRTSAGAVPELCWEIGINDLFRWKETKARRQNYLRIKKRLFVAVGEDRK